MQNHTYFNICKHHVLSFSLLPLTCCCSVTKSCLTLWSHELQHGKASLSFTISQNLLKLMFIDSVMPSNYLILSRPLLLLPSIFPIIRVFSNESALCISWPKYWGFSLNISPSQWILRTDFLRMDWLDLLTVQVVKQEIARVNVNILGIHT